MKKFTCFTKVSLFLISWFLLPLYGGHVPGTLVTTSSGFVAIENVSCADKVVGFNDQAGSPAEALIESNINELHYKLCDECYVIWLDTEELCVSADQKFYDLTTGTWVKSKNLNLKSVLVDIHGNPHQCLDIEVYDKPCGMYDMSIDAPHFYFTGSTQILTHNVVPVLVFSTAAGTPIITVSVAAAQKALVWTTIGAITLWNVWQNTRREKRNRNRDRQNEQQSTPNAPNQGPNKNDNDPKDHGSKEPKSSERKECEYKNVTKPGSKPDNIKTDIIKEEFKENMKQDDWNHKLSKDGKVDIFEKNGSKYTVRPFSKSTGGPTAEYFKNATNKDPDLKIRLLPSEKI